MITFTNKQGLIRLYDSTATPYYLQLAYDKGDFTGPLGRSRVEELLILHRGNMDANAHYVEGPDDKMMEPLELGFSCRVQDTAAFGYLLSWLKGDTVNAHTIVTTKGDTQNDGAVANPAFADSGKKCCNVEILFNGATDLLLQFNEVYFPLDQQGFAESGEEVTLTLKGMIYGTITTGSAFTAGTDVTV